MLILASAVLTASVLGSMHCVGMCGPLAIWASGASEQGSKVRLMLASISYHGGRMATYMLAGLLAGTVGRLVDLGGEALGFQLMAARFVGAAMILLGLHRLILLCWPPKQSVTPTLESASIFNSEKPRWRIGNMLVRLRPMIVDLPHVPRALATGLLTALLPCGWLYLFAFFAAATGNAADGVVVMIAFWIGTIPALVALVAGTRILRTRFTRAIPVLTAAILVAGGCFTASGRGFAKLGAMGQLQESARRVQAQTEGDDVSQQLHGLTQTPLPCCQQKETARGL